jgi:citronellol/citronellal dehydrogenase
MSTFTDRTLVVSGGSRGIGLAIALGAAKHGVNAVLLAKTAEPHPRLPGTVYYRRGRRRSRRWQGRRGGG